MRISNIEWLKKRIGFIRKLGEQTTRQRQIIDLLDNETRLTEQERKLLHVLATAEKPSGENFLCVYFAILLPIALRGRRNHPAAFFCLLVGNVQGKEKNAHSAL